jgi:diguanylate cyclase (GGDEF)-like protein
MGGTLTLDPVTGIPGRGELAGRLAEALRGRRCSLFLFDADHFKTVNDVYGHQRGDEVLREIAARAVAAVGAAGTVFRYGGDEFVVLLPDVPAPDALLIALRLSSAIRERAFGAEPPLHLSVSLGVATFPDHAVTADSLIEAADRRNYLAKRRGRGGVAADDAAAPAEAGSSRLWERDDALAAVHDFLTELAAHGSGSLRITGQPGAGHTRFLTEVGRLARMRGFTADRLLLADLDTDPVAVLGGRAAGIAYATTGAPADLPVPELGVARLDPWSPATVHIWLRAALTGEPSPALVTEVVRRSGGLPAAVARTLDQLRERVEVIPDGAGGWTLTANATGRPRRRLRLPAELTALVGRQPERRRVAELLTGNRLVTLAGPGGIGKTRLSVAAARDVADGFPDGVVFVPFADTADTDEAVRALAAALQVDDVPGVDLADALVDAVAEAEMLLVADNLEQVPGLALTLARLLGEAPGLRSGATSREPLGVYGEQVYRVPPLPAGDAESLFVQRARAASADFTAEPADVLALCERLDGLPLAIELVAARAGAYSAARLRTLLDQHLDQHLDVAGPRDRPERQQTLRGAIAWSHGLLDAGERRLFTGLAVFAGGCTAEAADAVLPGAAAGLARLVDKSLLTVEAQSGRFRMLATIRAYARELLTMSEVEREPVRRRHAGYFADLAALAADGMTGSDQQEWAERLDVEYANLRDAVGGALDAGDTVTAARICRGLWRYWRNGNHIAEGRRWLDRLLAAPAGLTDAEQAELLYPAAVLAATQDDNVTAAALGGRCLTLAAQAGDRPTEAQARNILGVAALRSGDYDAAADHFRFGLDVCRELGQPAGVAIALGNLAKLALRQGAIRAAVEYIDQCLELERAAGNSRGVLLGLECRTDIRLAQGDAAGARESAAEALELSRELGDLFGEAMAQHQLGLAAQADGDLGEAARLFRAALTLRHEIGDREDLANSFDCLAAVLASGAVDASAAGGSGAGAEVERAVRLVAAAGELRRRNHLADPAEAGARRDAVCSAGRAVLGDRGFATAWRAGVAMTIEEAVTCGG